MPVSLKNLRPAMVLAASLALASPSYAQSLPLMHMTGVGQLQIPPAAQQPAGCLDDAIRDGTSNTLCEVTVSSNRCLLIDEINGAPPARCSRTDTILIDFAMPEVTLLGTDCHPAAVTAVVETPDATSIIEGPGEFCFTSISNVMKAITSCETTRAGGTVSRATGTYQANFEALDIGGIESFIVHEDIGLP